MTIKFDSVLGKAREGTTGYTGTLYDSQGLLVAEVEDGVITVMY